MSTRAELRTDIRDKIGSWPLRQPTVSVGVTLTATSITVSDGSDIAQRQLIEIDSENMLVLSGSGNVLTVLRGYRGTIKAEHSIGTEVNVFDPWGWTNHQLNSAISRAIQWLRGDPNPAWTHDFLTFTWPASTRALDIGSAFIDWPHGPASALSLSFKDASTPAQYIRTDNWIQRKSMLLVPYSFAEAKVARLEIAKFQSDLTNDSTQLNSDDFTTPLILYSCYWALKNLQGSRPEFVAYSAALNERASTPDELLRVVFDFKNQADLHKRDIATPLPKRISKWKGGYATL